MKTSVAISVAVLAVAISGCGNPQLPPPLLTIGASAASCTDPLPTTEQRNGASSAMLMAWSQRASIAREMYIFGDRTCREWAVNGEVFHILAAGRIRTDSLGREIVHIEKQIKVLQSARPSP